MRLSKLQVFLMIAVTSFSATPFGYPTLWGILGRHVWLAGLLQLAVSGLGALGVALLLARVPGMTIAELAPATLGRPAGRAYLGLLSLYFLAWGPFGNLTVLIQLLHAVDAERTPSLALAAAMTVVAFYAARSGPEVVARAIEVWSWALVPGMLLIAVAPYLSGEGQIRPGLLLPMGLPDASVASDPTVWAYAIGARGFVLALALAGRIASGRLFLWPIVGGTLGAAALLAVIVTTPTVIFPPEVLARFRFPVVEALDTVDLAAFGLHSTVTVTLLLWPVVSWAVVASALWAGAECASAALGVGAYRRVLPFVAFTPLLAGLWTPDPAAFALFTHAWTALTYLVGLVAPWAMWFLAGRRKRAPRLRPDAAPPAERRAVARPRPARSARSAAGVRAVGLALAAASLFASGCGDVQDVNQRTLVYAVGLDAAPGGAVSVSLHYMSPHTAIGGGGGGGAGGGGGGGPAGLTPVTDSATAATVGGALDALRTAIPGGLFLGSVRVILIGEDLARRGIGPVLDHFIRTPREPVTTWVAVAQGRAEDLLRGPSPGEVSPARTIATILAVDSTETLSIAAVRQWELVNTAFVPDAAIPVAIVAATPDGPEVVGAAVFRGERMVATVETPDAALLRAMRARGAAEFSFEGPGGPSEAVAARIQGLSIRPELGVDGRDVAVRIEGLATILDSPTEDVGIAGAKRLQAALDRSLEERVGALLRRMYGQDLDVLGVGELFRERSPDGRRPADWPRLMRELRFTVEGRVQVVSGGRGY
ncbi:MAG: GerAB/ArcD/ProY family transporter [Clostridia bacterium]|nr:GerAB/ArcD/ProY family transporter [Clostridia bacterium]